MFYDTKNQQLLVNCPLNGYLPDGSLVQGLDLADSELQKMCGILRVISDMPPQPNDTIENVDERTITITDEGVIVNRQWVPTPTPVPETISARQVRLWLVSNNINLGLVQSLIDNIQDVELREKTQIEWEYSPYIERSHPLLESLGESLGLTPEQIDQGFILASQL